MYKSDELQVRIFNIIMIVLGSVSIISIIGNFISGFPMQINYKWIMLILICGLYFLVYRPRYSHEIFQLVFVMIVILVFIPIGWFESGGSNNNTIAYIFLSMMAITFLFRGSYRSGLVFLLIAEFIVLFLIEHAHPELFVVHDTRNQFLDRLIQIPITLTAGYLLLKAFANTHDNERKKIKSYSEALEDANKKLADLATRDPLTACYNRRAFDNELERRLHSGNETQIMLFDIDYFKDINDEYGHDVGDQCLVQVAKIAEKLLPDDAFIARWGGDEFAFIYNGDMVGAMNYAKAYQEDLKSLTVAQDLELTISMGIASLKKTDNIRSVLKRADDALYESKRTGKDCLNIG